jgi:CRP/FNR family cyclic AMP-dependent transcriptional regulator
MRVVSEQGKEAVVAVLGPGDFFGEGLNGHPLRMATTSAVDDSPREGDHDRHNSQ